MVDLPQVALSLLGDMRKDQVVADTIVFSAAMSACEKAGQWTAALDLFSQMQTLAVQLDTVTWWASSICFPSGKAYDLNLFWTPTYSN